MEHTQILMKASEWQALQIRQQADSSYALVCGETAVTTPHGHIVAHENYELIALIQREAGLWEGLDVTAVRPYSLFCTQTDFVAQGQDMVVDALPQFWQGTSHYCGRCQAQSRSIRWRHGGVYGSG